MIEQTQEIITSEEEKTINEFLANPENRKGALHFASYIEEVVGRKWFTIENLMKKSSMDKMQALQKLQMCKVFGVVALRIGYWKDKREQLREPLWKVTISTQDKLHAIETIIQYYNDSLADAEMTKKSLIAQLEKEKEIAV